MTRRHYIERILRQIYGTYVSDDSSITENLVNSWLNDGIALAAKQNYKENIAIDGIGFVNNSFYTTFKGIAVSKDERYVWKVELPQIPLGIGRNEGVSTIRLKETGTTNVSQPLIPITESQATFWDSMRPIPNKIIYKTEGGYAYIKSTLKLSAYTASVTLISGGVNTSLDSEINVPQDYFPVITDYIQKQLLLTKAQPQDISNDGADISSKW